MNDAALSATEQLAQLRDAELMTRLACSSWKFKVRKI